MYTNHIQNAASVHEVYRLALVALLGDNASLPPRRPAGRYYRELRDVTLLASRPLLGDTAIETRDVQFNGELSLMQEEFNSFHARGLRSGKRLSKLLGFAVACNRDGTLNSCYGHQVFHRTRSGRHAEAKHDPLTCWTYAINALKKDLYSQEAVLHFADQRNQFFGNRDNPGLLSGCFGVTGDKLNFSGTAANLEFPRPAALLIGWLCLLQHGMRAALLGNYPQLTCGYLQLHCHSMYLYDDRVPLTRRLVGTDIDTRYGSDDNVEDD